MEKVYKTTWMYIARNADYTYYIQYVQF